MVVRKLPSHPLVMPRPPFAVKIVLSETQASTPLLATSIWIVSSYQRLIQIEENGFHVLGQTRLVHVIFFHRFQRWYRRLF